MKRFKLTKWSKYSLRTIFEFILMGLCAIGLLWFIITLGIFVYSVAGYSF